MKKKDFMAMEFNSNIYYYDNEGKIYYTRLDAIESKKPCYFYYYDKEFSTKNWALRPQESLKELYRKRAQQIRDQYEHVVICYSGGIDSTQVLETFYYNNIHIDEILVVGAFSQDSYEGSDENHNGDIYHNVFPTLKKMHLPNTKISVQDYTLHFNDPTNFTLIKKYGTEFFRHIGMRTSVHNLFWYDLDKFLGHKKHTAYVMGKDKPILKYDDELSKWYVSFQDISFTDYSNRYDYSVGKRVSFYSEPDAFELMLKQCYSVKAMEEEYRNINVEARHNIINDDYLERVKTVVYDLKNPLKYQSKKSNSLFLSARDMYIVNKKNSDIYNIYAFAVREIAKTVPSLMFRERGIFSTQRYYLS